MQCLSSKMESNRYKFGKPNKIGTYGRFEIATLLNPLSREETKFELRTGISHSVLTLTTQKEKAQLSVSVERERRGTKRKRESNRSKF